METCFRNLVFKCICLRRILIIQSSFTCKVKLLLLSLPSCMAAKCGRPLGEMNFKKVLKKNLITSRKLFWEATIVIVFTFFFDY